MIKNNSKIQAVFLLFTIVSPILINGFVIVPSASSMNKKNVRPITAFYDMLHNKKASDIDTKIVISTMRSSSLWFSQYHNDDDDFVHKKRSNDNVGTSNNNNDDGAKSKKVLRKAFDVFEMVYSFFIQSAAAYFSVLMLLNISGYDYKFDPEYGLQIDTLENIRMENRFKREMMKTSVESLPKSEKSIANIDAGHVSESDSKMLETHWDDETLLS